MSAGAAAVYYSAMSSEQLRKECALAAILRELARYESVASRSWLSPVRSESDRLIPKRSEFRSLSAGTIARPSESDRILAMH
jgi:hypothetical protein